MTITAEQVARAIEAARADEGGISDALGGWQWDKRAPDYVRVAWGKPSLPDFIAALTRWHAELVAVATPRKAPDDTAPERLRERREALCPMPREAHGRRRVGLLHATRRMDGCGREGAWRMSATWVPYDDGRNYPLPAERRLVLVRVAVDHPDVSRDLIAVGYLRFAAGDVTCPYFVVPSAVCMLRIVAWCDCLPDEMQFGGAASPWLPQQPPQPLDRVQEPADEGGHVEQRDNAQRGED